MKQVIIITGPTASGKTSIAIRLAQKFQTEIISADSRQCYRELNIGVARPTPEQLQMVPHHFIASHSISENITAAYFEQFALKKVNELFRSRDTVVMTGGTGLYIKAFCEGLDEIPLIESSIRQQLVKQYEMHGLSWLQEELKKKDPAFYANGEIKNPQRSLRALEVIEGTGQSILSYQKRTGTTRSFEIKKIGIAITKEQLHHNIDHRVDEMMNNGLLDEVKKLVPYRDHPALRTVGYAELFEYLDGKHNLEDAVALIKTHTRQYAKRQLTWFRKDGSIDWMSGEKIENTWLSS